MVGLHRGESRWRWNQPRHADNRKEHSTLLSTEHKDIYGAQSDDPRMMRCR